MLRHRQNWAVALGAISSSLVPLTSAAALPERSTAGGTTASITLRCGAVWDAKRGRVAGPVTIEVRDGRIASVTREDRPLASGETDLRTSTCMPGLIDAHTHVLLESDRLEGDYDRQLLMQSEAFRTIVALTHARKLIDWGFTAIRDLGTEGAGYADVALRDAFDRGLAIGLRMQVATLAIAATGAYPLLGYAPRIAVPHGTEEVSGADEGRRAVRRQIAGGADLVKLYADRAPTLGPGGTVEAIPTLTREELKAMIDEAHRQGRKAAVNARASAANKAPSPNATVADRALICTSTNLPSGRFTTASIASSSTSGM